MKIAVIGAGLTGLAAAWKLSPEHDVLVLEKDSFTGGMASSHRVDWDGKAYSISKTYHHVLGGDATTVEFARRFGLDVSSSKVKQGFIYKGRIHPFSSPLEILSFPHPLMDKARLARFVMFGKGVTDWERFSGMSAACFITKYAGTNNYRVFFRKLLRNKFHEDPENIGAPWFGTRFFKEASSFMGRLGWIEGGIQGLVDGFAKGIEGNDGVIRTGAEVTSVSIKTGNVAYRERGKLKRGKFDRVISTIPPAAFLGLASGLAAAQKKALGGVRYLSCLSLAVGLKADPPACYWNNVLDEGLPFSVAFKHSQLYRDSCPPGKSVFFIAKYLKKGESPWPKRDDDIKELFLSAMDGVIPGFRGLVEWSRLFRIEDAEAIYSMGFSNPPESLGRVRFAGIYRIYPKIRNMASAIESGLEAADAIAQR